VLRAVAAFVLAAAAGLAAAGPTLSLDAQARAAVPNDELLVVIAVERDAPQPGPANDAVLRALEAALAEARRVDGVKARLGPVSTQPLVRDGRPQGWRVRGEAVLESTRVAELAQLAGRLGERLQLAAVQYRLSAERRQAEEKRLVAEAAKAFRARAAEAARAFGFADYELKSLALHAGGGGPVPRPMAMSVGRGGAEVAAAPLPADAGESEVVVGVSGSVELRP
jgi:predicted secreted protein